jgi:hypothetical protein
MDNIQNAMKLTNIEMKLGGSRSYYQSAGSMQGFELLNPDLTSVVPTTTFAVNMAPGWGYVANNLVDLNARTTRVANAITNNYAGEQRSIPLGLMSGVGRMKQYLPIALLGELSLVLIVGSKGEVMFQNSNSADADFSLSNVSLEYDVVVPDARYMQLLQKIASDPSDAGINLPFESSIITAGASIATSSTLTENSVIVSRATNHLLRTHLVMIPSNALQSTAFPSQSAFTHAGTWSVQWRVGSQVYPQIAAAGDASMFNTALLAYGSCEQENGSVLNRALWGQNTSTATLGTAATFETAQISTGGTLRYCFADSFIPSYGFQTVKGAAQAETVDGISLAGASGSQLITTVVSASGQSVVPFVCLVALKFIRAQGAGVSIIGA